MQVLPAAGPWRRDVCSLGFERWRGVVAALRPASISTSRAMACHCLRSGDHWRARRCSPRPRRPLRSPGRASAALGRLLRGETRSWRARRRGTPRRSAAAARRPTPRASAACLPTSPRLGQPIEDVVAIQRLDARTRRRDRPALSRSAAWRSASARAASSAASRSRTTSTPLEIGDDGRLNVGVGQQLDPRHARRRSASRSCVEVADRRAPSSAPPGRAPLLIGVLEPGPASGAGAAGAPRGFNSALARFCAALVRAFSAIALSVSAVRSTVDRGNGRVGVLAAQRHAFELGRSVSRSIASSRAPASAPCRAMLPSAFARRASPASRRRTSSGPADLGHGGQLALAAERRQRGHRGHRRAPRRACRPARPAGPARDRARCLPTRCGRCRRAPRRRRCAPPRRGGRARRRRRWRTRRATRVRRVSSSWMAFDANGGIGVRGLGLGRSLSRIPMGRSDPGGASAPASASL